MPTASSKGCSDLRLPKRGLCGIEFCSDRYESEVMSGRLPLTRSQITILAILGAVLWLAAALLLRALAPFGIYEGTARVILYLLVIPGTVPFVLLAKTMAKLAPDQIAIGLSVLTAAAILLDGIALAWFPRLYGSELAHFAGAGAVILWGGGVGLVLGFLMNRVRS